MRCTKYICQSDNILVERTIKNEQDRAKELPVRFNNINTTIRRYKCQSCNSRFLSVELPESDLLEYLKQGSLGRPKPAPTGPSLRPKRGPSGP